MMRSRIVALAVVAALAAPAVKPVPAEAFPVGEGFFLLVKAWNAIFGGKKEEKKEPPKAEPHEERDLGDRRDKPAESGAGESPQQ